MIKEIEGKGVRYHLVDMERHQNISG